MTTQTALIVLLVVLIAALAVLAWHCGRLKHQAESLRFENVKLSGQLFMALADDATRRGLGGLGDESPDDEWPDILQSAPGS